MEEQKAGKTDKILLILTVIFGFIFRLINVNTRVLLGDPPHFAIQAINFFNSGLLVIWDQSTYLWYAFTSIFYGIFGITQFASRFSSLLFGTLSIFAIYLFVLEFSGNKRLALISAMIYAFAPGFIWQAADEHDISALFFIITSFYTLIRGLKRDSKYYLILSGIIFGVAAMWKAYVAILLIPYLGLIFYYHYTKKFDAKKNYKVLLLSLAIIFMLVTPTLVYNYLNYKHNGVVDFLFANFLYIKNDKIYSLYGWTAGQEIYSSGGLFTALYKLFIDGNQASSSDNLPIIYHSLSSLYSNGHILSVMILIGVVFMFLKRRKDPFAKDYLIFFMLYFIIPFLFISYGNYLSKHLIQFIAFSIPMTAYIISESYDYAHSKFSIIGSIKSRPFSKYIAYSLILLFVFFVLLSYITPNFQSFMSPNSEDQLIKYKLSNIPQDSLIIYDDRIYNSEAGWLFNDRYYIPVSLLQEFQYYNENSSFKQQVPVYIVECAIDDCGWGTVASNQPLNLSMEGFFDSVKNQSISVVYEVNSKITYLDTNYYNPLISSKVSTPVEFRVYKTQMSIDLNLAKQVKMQYSYFLYPTGYLNKNDKIFQNFIYTPSGFIEEMLNNFTWFIFYLNIILSLLIILFLLLEIYFYL